MDFFGEIGNAIFVPENDILENPIFTPKNKAELRAALKEWDENKNIAIEKYGYIERWNVSRITDMSLLFFI